MSEQKMVTIVTPVLNSMRTLDEYMQAIIMQDYPHDKIDIIIADGGSTDGTIERFNEYSESEDIKIQICNNTLKTAEAGKAVAARLAKGEIILLLDSDNIIPDSHWMTRMMEPFGEREIVAAEPIEYTWREQDGYINRYCAMIGMGDPLCLFTGNYDRKCILTGKWTEVKREEIDRGDYVSVKFQSNMIPTIGANGFFMRRRELIDNFEGDYLFDIDVLWELFKKNPELRVAKVKTGIVHLFCQDIGAFKRKQNRRVRDYIYYSDAKGRKYPWGKTNKWKIVLFSICCITCIPLLIQATVGNIRKHDPEAWKFHFKACWITLWIYGCGVIRGIFRKDAADRNNWKQ